MEVPEQMRRAAIVAQRAGDLVTARGHYARYLAQRPGDAGVWSNLGTAFRKDRMPRQALRAQLRALALDPDVPGVRNNCANALSDMGRYEQSAALRRRLLEDDPNDIAQKSMLIRCARSAGDYAEAIRLGSGFHAEHPDEAEIELQLAFALLGAGEYEAGFRHYEARWRAGELKPQSFPFPRWEGGDLTGARVLVVPEQGFGDAVLMLRFLPWLKRAGAAHVTVLAEKPMARLFAGLEGADSVVASIRRDAGIDVWLPHMELPLLGLRTRDDVPAPARLSVPDDSAARAARIVAPHDGAFRVGIVWSGSETYRGNAFRSFSHRDMMGLADVPGVQLYSLYKGPGVEGLRADGSDVFAVDAGSSDRDFADCAGLMRRMDLIVTSDTATAHVAGSLGVPVWAVLHWDAFWVYTHHGETTPWYPTMRLWRQDAPLEWSGVFARIEAALRQEVAR